MPAINKVPLVPFHPLISVNNYRWKTTYCTIKVLVICRGESASSVADFRTCGYNKFLITTFFYMQYDVSNYS